MLKIATRRAAGNGIVNEMTFDAQRYWPRSISAGALQLTYNNYDGVGSVQAIGDSRWGWIRRSATMPSIA